MWVPRGRGVERVLPGLGIRRCWLWYGPWNKDGKDGIGYAEEQSYGQPPPAKRVTQGCYSEFLLGGSCTSIVRVIA